jgi:NitT/TauT family transport system substrate-binding protein
MARFNTTGGVMHSIVRQLVAPGLILVLALSACGSDSDSGGGGGGSKNATLLMNWFAQAEQGGYWQAEAQNLGKSNGVSVKVLQGGPQIQTIPQVAAGKADFGVAQADEILLAREKGVPIVEVFAAMQIYPQCMMFHPDVGISSFQDFDGHQIAVAPSGGFWPYLKGRFKLNDVKEINFTGQLAEFKRNKNLIQQCFITSEPYFATQQGIPHKTLLVADSGYNPYAQGLFTSEKMIKENPGLVRKVVATAQKGWEEFLKNPAPARGLVIKTNKDMEAGPFNYAWKQIKARNLLGAHVGEMTEQRWARLVSQLRQAGVMKKQVDPKTAYTDRFLPKS